MDYRTRLNDAEGEIADIETSLRAYYRDIGSKLFQSGAQLPAVQAASEAAASAEARGAEIEKLDNERSELEGLESELGTLDQEEHNFAERSAELEREMHAQFEKIGRAAYEAYTNSERVDESISAMFGDIAANRNDISDLEQELKDAESDLERRPFLEKMVSRGKIALLRNRLATKEGAQPRLYRTLGARVIESALFTQSDDEAFAEASRPYHDLKAKLEKLEKEKKQIMDRRTAIRESVQAKAGDNRNVERAIREIVRRREHAVSERDRAFEGIGRAADCENPMPEAAELCGEAQRLAMRLGEKRELQKRLRAAIEVSRIESELEVVHRRSAAVAKQIDELKTKLKSINGEAKSLEKRRQEQEELKGPDEALR